MTNPVATCRAERTMSKKSKAQRAERWQRRNALTSVTRVQLRVGEDCKVCAGPHRDGAGQVPHFRTTGVHQRLDDPKAVRDELGRIDDETESVKALLFGFSQEAQRLEDLLARIPDMLSALASRQARGAARLEALLRKREKALYQLEGARRSQELEALTQKLLDKKKVLASLRDGTAPVPPTVVMRAERSIDMVSIGDTQYIAPTGEKNSPRINGVVLKTPTKRR